ncbi:MAG: 50S ribosomal protein L22 [Actinomycetota bacterium]|nr:50S ribosomal protein L22 [Actinomycetota bacterium]
MAAITFDERKTNERPGVRAVHRHARFSAYKAREVLDLIRGKSVAEARTILQFCDRSAAETVAKVLDSAVANAANNNDIPPEELFVASCFADEGPTMKRWRPRARGRATRIRKRTCHITVIVGRYTQTELDTQRARLASKGRTASSPSADRARRVQRSRSGAGSVDTEATEAEAAEAETDEAATAAVIADDAPETTTDDAADDTVAEPAAEAESADDAAAVEDDAADETEKKDD